MKKNLAILITILMMVMIFSVVVFSQTTEFVYQGQLQNLGTPANGSFDFEFLLFDTPAGPNQVGPLLMRNGIIVASGGFSVKLDFGSSFPGPARFIEIHVRQTGGGAFTPLTPRQLVGSAPYSIKTLNADTSTNSAKLGGVDSSLFVQQDAGGNVAITGGLTVAGTLTQNIVNATTQYNLGGDRVLAANLPRTSVSVGQNTGNVDTGFFNTFIGVYAGQSNSTGVSNTFVGNAAGNANTVGEANSFFGAGSGSLATAGSRGSFSVQTPDGIIPQTTIRFLDKHRDQSTRPVFSMHSSAARRGRQILRVTTMLFSAQRQEPQTRWVLRTRFLVPAQGRITRRAPITLS